MVKVILLKFDEEFGNKMKRDKLRRERQLGRSLTWEDYIQVLFGFAKLIKL